MQPVGGVMQSRDLRTAVRMPKYLGAKIQFNNRQSLIDCIVRNQSREGALIVLGDVEIEPGRRAVPP